jgi:hypothetical protein
MASAESQFPCPMLPLKEAFGGHTEPLGATRSPCFTCTAIWRCRVRALIQLPPHGMAFHAFVFLLVRLTRHCSPMAAFAARVQFGSAGAAIVKHHSRMWAAAAMNLYRCQERFHHIDPAHASGSSMACLRHSIVDESVRSARKRDRHGNMQMWCRFLRGAINGHGLSQDIAAECS